MSHFGSVLQCWLTQPHRVFSQVGKASATGLRNSTKSGRHDTPPVTDKSHQKGRFLFTRSLVAAAVFMLRLLRTRVVVSLLQPRAVANSAFAIENMQLSRCVDITSRPLASACQIKLEDAVNILFWCSAALRLNGGFSPQRIRLNS